MNTCRSCSVVLAGMIVALIAIAAPGYAQEAVLSGTVTDSTGGVLPGVAITAVNIDNGNAFTAVTDGKGEYRIVLRVGPYKVTAELSGFQTVTRMVQLLLGQQAVLNAQMAPSTLAETVTVTGEAPLIDTSTTQVGSNIDPKQMAELPINGRNFMDLTLLVAGARRNDAQGYVQPRQGYSQTVIDGQQVTTIYHSGGDDEQPHFSRDAISEFQVLQNQFDASHGRSQGMIVNAITKSGTNMVTGTFGSYFRSDRFKAKDFVAHRVLPYSDQQVAVTLGGPIIKDRLHYFVDYEFERQPKTFTYTTPYPAFNGDVTHVDTTHLPLGRIDYQITSATRLSVRGSGYKGSFGAGGSSTAPIGNASVHGRTASQYYGTLTHVIGNGGVNELEVGATAYERADQPNVRWNGQDFPNHPVLNGGSVNVIFRDITIGASPLNIFQDTQTLHDQYTTTYNWGGHHDLKIGGEYMRFHNEFRWCLRCDGVIDARGGPTPANVQELFPDTLNAATWNLAPLASQTIRVIHSISDTGQRYNVLRNLYSGWIQDDWKTSNKMTLNLGVRYDWDSNGHGERITFAPWTSGHAPRDATNFAPRLGVNYVLTDKTVLRGGYGLFFAFAPNDGVQQTAGYLHRFEEEIPNNGLPTFTTYGGSNGFVGWFNGPIPTWNEAIPNACDVNLHPGCTYRALTQEVVYPGRETPYSHQASAGIEHQIGANASFSATYVYTGGRGEEPNGSGETTVNGNLTYNPATGANYPFTDLSHRAFPGWGTVNMEYLAGWSNYHAGEFTFTKRLSNHWQATANYTLSFFKDATPYAQQWHIDSNGLVAHSNIDFPLAPDMGGEYGWAHDDQRHAFNANGIWDVGAGFELTGIYFYGSGERFSTTTNVDLRNMGGSGENRLLADGSILPRNGLVGKPIHRVDMRLQKAFNLGSSRRQIMGLLEVFNVFNHVNYGSYVTNFSSKAYGSPVANVNEAYQPRMLQLGLRVVF